MITQRQLFWSIPLWFAVFLVAMPVCVVVFSWSNAQSEVWRHLLETGLSRLLFNTAFLVVGVATVVVTLGVSLAWLTACCEFPGRRWLDWALVLPLAIPTYVVAFTALGFMGYSGPVLTFWRELFGRDAWYPDIRSRWGVVLTMSAVLYPYVYMLARSAFLQQGRRLMDASQTLGVAPIHGFFKVALPMARPAIVTGTALALMEALADFGAVAVFNYDTFTTAIYKSWFGFFNLQAAAQLASLLLLIVGLGLMAEQGLTGKGAAHAHSHKSSERIQLIGWQAVLATSFCAGVVALAFLVPVGQLMAWLWSSGISAMDQRFLMLVRNTFLLGLIAAVFIVSLACLVSLGQRFGRAQPGLMRFTSFGYALPGSVLAVGVMIAFTFIDRELLSPVFALFYGEHTRQFLVGSLAALVVAYVIRYFSVGLGPIQSNLERIKPSLEQAAQTLGSRRRDVIRRVYLPMLSPATLTAAILVLVDVMKEMPATLLLRPFGWDTLAIRVYEMTSEGEWQRAALPAIVLVIVSAIPVVLMIRKSRQ